MSINFEDVKTSLYIWATQNLPSGTPVIMGYSNSPRPTTPYCMLYLNSLSQIGWDVISQPTDDSGVEEQVGDREFILQVQTYGTDCLTRLENLRSSLQKQSVLDSLNVNGIIFVLQFPIQDITELISSRFEPRAQMDILFRIAQVYSDNSGAIDTVNLEEVFNNGVRDVYDKIVQIPPS